MYIMCIEANGDRSKRKLSKDKQEIYASFIYPGKGLCQLIYKGKVINSVEVESRTPGWSVYLKEETTISPYLLIALIQIIIILPCL